MEILLLRLPDPMFSSTILELTRLVTWESITLLNKVFCDFFFSFSSSSSSLSFLFFFLIKIKTVVVAFRGTEQSSLENWITDLSFAQTTIYSNVPNAEVHSGMSFVGFFYTFSSSIREPSDVFLDFFFCFFHLLIHFYEGFYDAYLSVSTDFTEATHKVLLEFFFFSSCSLVLFCSVLFFLAFLLYLPSSFLSFFLFLFLSFFSLFSLH